MSDTTFSVVIPAYNEREFVGLAIRSVLAQTRSDWELIVVDDGSTDDTADQVRPFADGDSGIALVSKENGGLSAARNTAIERATAPLISFLDSDDMWLPGYLDAMHAALADDPRAGVAYTHARSAASGTRSFRPVERSSTAIVR